MENAYNTSSIDVLTDIQHLRLRPSMYIGSVDQDGVHHLFKEVLDNCLDEYLAKQADTIWVSIKDNSITVRDNGRGIPVDIHPTTGKSTLTTVLTQLQAGGKFKKGAYSVSSGLHGVGLKAVNFLSSKLKVTTWVSKGCYQQMFVRGVPLAESPFQVDSATSQHGTEITFVPDEQIFSNNQIDAVRVQNWIKDLVHLCPGLHIHFSTEDQTVDYFSEKGLEHLVADRSAPLNALDKTLRISTSLADIALLWTDGTEEEQVFSYCNISPTPEHGTHVTGLKKAVAQVLGSYTKQDINGADLRAGLFAAIHVHVQDPIFKGQTKGKLQNSSVENEVYDLVFAELQKYFETNKALAKSIVDRAIHFKKAREQYKKLKQVTSSSKSTKETVGVLPGKLTESPRCSIKERELFICEGASAAGSVIAARDPFYQEVLPLRGKVPNAQRQPAHLVLKNEEMQAIMKSVGIGYDPATKSNDLSGLRVNKVLLLCDADQDGCHITTLVLSFFMNYLHELLEQCKVFVVVSPLFQATNAKGDKHWYGDSISDIEQKAGLKASQLQISRLKGHGEADAKDLKHYAMDPKTRKLIQLSTDLEQDKLFASYMGSDSDVRKSILGIL